MNLLLPTPRLLLLLMFVADPLAAAEPVPRSAAPETSEPAPLSIMTWNLEWFFDDSKQDNFSKLAKEKSAPSREQWNWQRDAVAESIAQVKPTIAALQEVEGQRVLWYLTEALDREHELKYDEHAIEGNDRFTEQDVGLLTRAPAEVLSIMRGNVTTSMRKTGDFGSVSKHLAALIEIPVNGKTETVLIVNVHFRSGEAGASIRAKQATSLNRWIQVWEKTPVHVVVIGDFNTEETAGNVAASSEMSILMTRSTDDPADDLVDLLETVEPENRQTHLLDGKQFDRILVSRSLIDDDPQTLDLCLRRVTVRKDLAVCGAPDTAETHWDGYWDLPDSERDLSDHYPIIAEFDVR